MIPIKSLSSFNKLDETLKKTAKNKEPFIKCDHLSSSTSKSSFKMSSCNNKFNLINSNNLAFKLLFIACLVGFVPINLASNVRSTKSYDFKETDGSAPGFIMFNLDKIHPSEVFKIESPNRWVSVDTTGAVRVKEPWDYEQLGKEHSIDFWIIITSPNLNGKCCVQILNC